MRDLQQNEFQRQFNFLQPRAGSVSEKEMIFIGATNSNNNTMPPPFPNDKNSRMINKIKNSSSFPQSFDNIEYLKQQQNLAKRPPIERKQSKNQHFDHQNKLPTSSHFNASSSVVPLIVGNSTTTLINTRRSPQQQQPRTNAFNNLNNNNYQQQQHYYRSPNVSGTIEQMKKYQQQPQTVICRRSTSLPRRIISAAQNSPTTKHPPQHSSEHQQRNDFYQKPPLMGTNYANKNL